MKILMFIIQRYAIIYFWRRYRVNYPFIFGFKEGSALGYREVLLFAFGFAMIALASILANLYMEMDPKTEDYQRFTELFPLGVVVLAIVIIICPFNIIYRSSRFFIFTCVFHFICAPLYKVALADFFLEDQLTSQVQALRSLEIYICYYGSRDYAHRDSSCSSNDIYRTFHYIIAIIPYWSRLLQCLRWLFEDGMQGLNRLKYYAIIVAVTTRTVYSRSRDCTEWYIIAWVASGVAAASGTYWDLVLDWGLLQRNSKNRWLRDKLIIPHHSVYFGAMVSSL